MPESIRSKDVQKKAALIGRLYNNNVIDLSDGEIERCLRNTCSPTKLIAITKRLRDSGSLTIDEIYALDTTTLTCHTQPNENAMPWRAR